MAFALFDFDGTLSKGDSIIPFMKYCAHKKFASRWSLVKAAVLGALYLAGFVKDETWAKEKAMDFLRGKTYEETQAIAKGFYQEVLSKRMYRDGVLEVGQCLERGMIVLIVSASPDAYMEPVRMALGAEAVLATQCELDKNQVYTGRFASRNCRGFEKTLRIAQYLAAKGYELDPEASAAYGDSAGDWPMMTLTARPIAVNARKKLIEQSQEMERVIWR